MILSNHTVIKQQIFEKNAKLQNNNNPRNHVLFEVCNWNEMYNLYNPPTSLQSHQIIIKCDCMKRSISKIKEEAKAGVFFSKETKVKLKSVLIAIILLSTSDLPAKTHIFF